MRLTQRDIVCVSVMDWDHPFRSSRHHLMQALAQRNRVLFVNNQANPFFALRHWREPRGQRMWRHWLRKNPNPERLADGLWVYTPPPVIPMGQVRHPGLFAALYHLNQRSLRTGVQQACRQLGFERPLLWISFNTLSSESLVGALNEELVIYHCTDAIEAMPGHSPHAPAIERRLLARADLVFCSSRALEAAKTPYNPACHFIPNGADVELFGQAWHRDCPPLPALPPASAGPTLGFAGHMEERFDFALLTGVAAARPRWQFVLAGPVAPSCRAAARALDRLPNVHMLGLLPRERLPAFFKGCDALLIPFVCNAQTRAIYPLKLNEYLATGKPVALTPFANLQEFNSWVHTGAGVAGFLAACEGALGDQAPSRAQERLAVARGNSWGNRILSVEAAILATLDKRPLGELSQAVVTMTPRTRLPQGDTALSKEASFDIVSKVDMQEATNAVHQAQKEIEQRFDLKGSGASVELEKETLVLKAPDEMKLKNVLDVVEAKFIKRNISLKSLDYGKIESALGGNVKQNVTLKQGIDKDQAKKIINLIKETKLKVQAQIQEDQIRVTGKSRDDLQAVIAKLKAADLELDLQFSNYR